MVPLIAASANLGRAASSSADAKHRVSGMPKRSAAWRRRSSEGSATPTILSRSGRCSEYAA